MLCSINKLHKMEAKDEIIVKKEKKSKCHNICQTNLLDYVLLIEIKRVFSSVNHSSYRLLLRNLFSRRSSAVEIQTDESSRKKINLLWLEIWCYDCVRIRDKFKDVINSLLSLFDRPKLSNHNKVCRLFFARIFANDWRRHCLLVSEFTCDLEAKLKNSTNDSNNKSPGSNMLLPHIEKHHNKNVTLNINNGADRKKEANLLKRKRGKEEKNVSLEDITSYISRSFTLKEAAECLQVSRSTLKRKCRQLGISQWQPSNGIKRFRCTLQCKKVSKSSSTVEDTNLKSISLATDDDVLSQHKRTLVTGKTVPEFASQSEAVTSFNSISLSPDGVSQYRSVCGTPKCDKEARFLSRIEAASMNSHASAEDLLQYRTSYGTPKSKRVAEFGSSVRNISQYNSMNQNFTESRSLILFPITNSHASNSARSIQLDSNLSGNTKTVERLLGDQSNEKISVQSYVSGQSSSVSSPLVQQADVQDGMTSLIKTTYKDDMVRFHFSFKANIVGLKKEVARRLNLKLGAFKLKYLDDEDEWTLLASDLDWQEFVYISRSSRKNAIRLLVQDIRREEEGEDDLQATWLKL